MLSFFARLPVCLVGMEACWGAHYWAREIQKLGHTVRLMAPQYVKAYVKTNKNDAADAEAIAEAVTRPSMRFVPVKTQDQQAMLALHRVRQGLIKARTAQANQIRSFLAECGVVIPAGLGRLRRALPMVLSEEERVDGLMRQLLVDLAARLRSLDDEVARLDRHIAEFNRRNQDCRRLETIPGVGPITASALVAAVGNATAFCNGRELAAWLRISQHAIYARGKGSYGPGCSSP
ncbi:IS110 family transposase [Paraburkholderia sp. 40]|uniref:IS110 family transposase n=1 Tax=Paraburkholderia sp. 40 TaxID=2991059 RepID=UPI003D1D979A